MTDGIKRCAVCDDLILGCDVRLAAEEEERCHDCADYCDEPDCERCARAGEKR